MSSQKDRDSPIKKKDSIKTPHELSQVISRGNSPMAAYQNRYPVYRHDNLRKSMEIKKNYPTPPKMRRSLATIGQSLLIKLPQEYTFDAYEQKNR